MGSLQEECARGILLFVFMSKRTLVFFIVILPLCLFAQGSPSPSPSAGTNETSALSAAPPAPDAAELTKLLKDFLAGASRNDLAAHERFWTEDLIYTGSVGRRFGKADILREVRAEGDPKPGAENTN
jgi:hypothetical protein